MGDPVVSFADLVVCLLCVGVTCISNKKGNFTEFLRSKHDVYHERFKRHYYSQFYVAIMSPAIFDILLPSIGKDNFVKSNDISLRIMFLLKLLSGVYVYSFPS